MTLSSFLWCNETDNSRRGASLCTLHKCWQATVRQPGQRDPCVNNLPTAAITLNCAHQSFLFSHVTKPGNRKPSNQTFYSSKRASYVPAAPPILNIIIFPAHPHINNIDSRRMNTRENFEKRGVVQLRSEGMLTSHYGPRQGIYQPIESFL